MAKNNVATVLHENSKNLSGMLPNLDGLVSTAERMLSIPKSLAGNVEASAETGSLIKTFLTWFAIVSVVYWLNYFFITFISKSGIKGIAKIFTKSLKIYPPLYPENLDWYVIPNMFLVMLLLAVGIASLAIFLKSLKYRGKKPQN